MKRTKIVCTIGPASEKQNVLEQMIRAGMNMARLNMSHGDYAWHQTAAKTIRAAAKKINEPVALLLDLQGPKIRVGKLRIKNYELRVGERVVFTTGKVSGQKIPIDYKLLHQEIKKGHRILLADGLMECLVEEVKGKDIKAKVIAGGILISHKGINLPDTKVGLKSLTAKDKKDLLFGLRLGVDFVAFSFARSADDVLELRELINKAGKQKNPVRIIVKVEKREAVKNFDAILAATDGMMVARGDLALETESARLPLVQKEIIIKCRKAGKPVIVATEMLASMEKNPRPTRAEISDVANAVIDHTDAVMLSAESAMGRYPAQTVATMAKIIKETEKSHFDDVAVEEELKMPCLDKDDSLIVSAILARRKKAKAILVMTPDGRAGRLLSRLRVEIPVAAGSPFDRVARQLNLSWGVYPFQAKTKKELLEKAKKLVKFEKESEVIMINY